MRLWVGLTCRYEGHHQDAGGANNKALNTPEVQKALAAQGFAPMIGTAEQFDAFYRTERDKWAKVIRAAGLDKE